MRHLSPPTSCQRGPGPSIVKNFTWRGPHQKGHSTNRTGGFTLLNLLLGAEYAWFSRFGGSPVNGHSEFALRVLSECFLDLLVPEALILLGAPSLLSEVDKSGFWLEMLWRYVVEFPQKKGVSSTGNGRFNCASGRGGAEAAPNANHYPNWHVLDSPWFICVLCLLFSSHRCEGERGLTSIVLSDSRRCGSRRSWSQAWSSQQVGLLWRHFTRTLCNLRHTFF